MHCFCGFMHCGHLEVSTSQIHCSPVIEFSQLLHFTYLPCLTSNKDFRTPLFPRWQRLRRANHIESPFASGNSDELREFPVGESFLSPAYIGLAQISTPYSVDRTHLVYCRLLYEIQTQYS